ncbi:HlyD family secretion protein [Phytohalomonas tamaricis]|uniref:HlyD family secretion protein n=1 Tax=Phytohalomonas tamaricis TaxID=2081032 RepID=UPI000D0AFFDA|nr:HlyD family secretion protein [Phytohalomonas tamaricis]
MSNLLKKWLRRLVVVTLLIAVVVAAIFWGMHWYYTGRFFEETDNAYVRGDIVSVRSELSARVTRVAVAHNQRVTAGDLLVDLDETDYRDQLEQAHGQLAQAEASVIQAERNIGLQQATIEQNRAQIAASEAQLKQARQTLERSRQLAQRDFASRQQLDEDQANFDVAKANLAADRAALVSAQRQLDVQEAAVDEARAQRQTARAELAQAEHQLAKTHLYAPFDGVVGNVNVERGTLAQPSLALMSLVPIDALYVVANYKETQVERMRIGQHADIHVDAYPGITFEGVIDSLAPATGTEFSLLPNDNATGNFNKIVQRVPVRIRLTGPEKALHYLRAGLSVEPRIDTRGKGESLYVAPDGGAGHDRTDNDTPHAQR